MSKYGNRKLDTPDGVFDSVGEYGEWCNLRILERCGEIRNLRRQVLFELQPAFKRGKRRVLAITIILDFAYDRANSGDWVPAVKDHKGMITPVAQLKLKMFQYRYPQYELWISTSRGEKQL